MASLHKGRAYGLSIVEYEKWGGGVSVAKRLQKTITEYTEGKTFPRAGQSRLTGPSGMVWHPHPLGDGPVATLQIPLAWRVEILVFSGVAQWVASLQLIFLSVLSVIVFL
jgi:hypothetical protein